MIPTVVHTPLPDTNRLQLGGSAWWYVDLVDPEGNGVVLVVALGLPFLPGYASSSRAGRPRDPRAHPSVALSTVRAGRPDFYVLQPLPWLTAEGGRWSWPGSEIAVRFDGDRVRLDAHLQGDLPGCAWSARIAIDGRARLPHDGELDHADHEWTVLTAACQGTATVTAGGDRFDVTGRAYVDRNLSVGPWSGGGWTWGRIARSDRDLLWYADDHRATALSVGHDGRTDVLDDVHLVGLRYGAWGVPRPASVTLDAATVALDRPVDDGPFYTRVLLRDGDRAVGFAESCRIDRIDQAWSRPLVRMAVSGPWHPLFSGPRRGRILRWIRQLARV